MAEVRRRAPRKKSVKAEVNGDVLALRASWSNEALAVLCCALTLFLSLSFLSHQFSGWDRAPGENLMGPIGHVIGTLMGGFLGWCALLPLAWLGWVSFYFWNRDDEEPLFQINSKALFLAGLVGMFLFSAACGDVLGGPLGGGSIGAFLAQPLKKLIGPMGSGLIFGALLLICLALITGRSVATIIGSSFKSGRVVLGFSLLKCPIYFLRIMGLIAHSIGLLFRAVFELVLPKSFMQAFRDSLFGRLVQTEERTIPRPRIRKNLIEKDPDSSENADSEQESASEEEVKSARKDEEQAQADLEPEVVRAVVRRREKSSAQRSDKKPATIEPPNPKYITPSLDLLARGEPSAGAEDDDELLEISRQIEAKLKDFDIEGRVTQVHPGPVITLFEFEPAPGVKVGRIAALQDDLAMSLKASSIRIIAPIPKRGTVGIEVPNRHRDLVRLRDLLEADNFKKSESILSVPIGKDTYGDPFTVDIATMPHFLMAGATGTGKSVCINAMLISLLYRASPEELGLILIDPKILELSIYEGIPHLRVPVVTVPRQARAVLEWAINEMNRRYRVMQKYGVRNIDSYNRFVSGEREKSPATPNPKSQSPLTNSVVVLREEDIIQQGTVERGGTSPQAQVDDLGIAEELRPMPKILIVVDELADLMLSVGREIEACVTRLAQKARAAGIHLIVATQRPSVDVITGLIKANFPARLSFRVSSRVDSRTILDSMGADKLLGRGDMLVMLPGGAEGLKRVHGAFVSDNEVKAVVDCVKKQSAPKYDENIMAICEKALEEENSANDPSGIAESEYDEMYDRAVEFVLEKGQASTSMLQRAFRLGYNRAARIIEMMEREGLVGPMDGSKPREVLVQSLDGTKTTDGNAPSE